MFRAFRKKKKKNLSSVLCILDYLTFSRSILPSHVRTRLFSKRKLIEICGLLFVILSNNYRPRGFIQIINQY